MDTFTLLALCEEKYTGHKRFPHTNGQWSEALMFSILTTRISCSTNRQAAVDLRAPALMWYHCADCNILNSGSHSHCPKHWPHLVPTNTQRIKPVIVTSKRRFDVTITCLLRCVFAGVSCRMMAWHLTLLGISHFITQNEYLKVKF